MKRWLNNWEKIIGDRLRKAEAEPGGHVWDLIEQELDNHTARRAGVYRNTYILALFLLLFLGFSAAFWIPGPAGQKAYNDRAITISEISHEFWTIIPGQPQVISPTADKKPKGDVSAVIAESESMERSEQAPGKEKHFAGLQVDKLLTIQSVSEYRFAAETDHELAEIALHELLVDIDRDLQRSREVLSVLTIPADMEYSMPSTPGETLHKYELHELNGVKGVSGLEAKMELLRRKADNYQLRAGLIVRTDDPALNVYQQISQLAMQGLHQSGNTGMYKQEEDMSLHAVTELQGTRFYSEHGEEVLAAVYERTERVAAAEKLAAERSSWISEALSELETWKKSLSEQEEESRELKDLIEEAVIDEDDPLTKRQNATKDLYRAHNINKGFHIGMVAGVTSTWVTRASRNPEVNRNNVDYRFNPGYQVGLNMGYDITEHFGLMTEFKYSGEGGRYLHPLGDRKQHIDLRYIEFPVYAKIKHSRLSAKMRPLVFNYLAGVTYKDLRTVKVSNGGKDERFGQDYNTSEWGLSAGFDFDFYINKNLFWTIGARAGVAGNAKDFPRMTGKDGQGPLSISTGLYTRFNFRLPGK
jgi:opacity protein-like surface antigen